MYYNYPKNEIRFFSVTPSVVEVGKKTRVKITPIHKQFAFADAEYIIRIAPKEQRDIPRNSKFNIIADEFNEYTIKVKDNSLEFDYLYSYEQEYVIIVFTVNKERKYTFVVYALNSDLFGTMPFKGDLHLHSTCSDGRGTLAQVAGAYRGAGNDFICLTDHHRYQPSVDMEKLFADVDCGLKVFHGEEVHNCDMGYFHIINFDSKYSVNKVIESDYDNIFAQIQAEAKSVTVPANINPVEYTFRRWICNEIHKAGGLAIFPHQFWTICDQNHTETEMGIYTIKQKLYDAVEILAGCDHHENNMQVALYQDLRASGDDIPIVGSTDAHDFIPDPYASQGFGYASTIVFAKSVDGVRDAVLNKQSVAVESIINEHPNVYGPFRLVKYTIFLLANFYPRYINITKDLNSLMNCFAEYGDCKTSIHKVNAKAQQFKNNFFGIVDK